MSILLIHHQKTPTGALINAHTMGETSVGGYSSLDTKKQETEICRESGSLAFILTEHVSCLALPFRFPYKSKSYISLTYFSLLLAPDLWLCPTLKPFLQEIAVIALHVHYLEHCLEKDRPEDKEKIMSIPVPTEQSDLQSFLHISVAQ